MSVDPEIQFGDLEEEQPDIELRPDRNAHYAVVPYENPVEGELPIFVDLDVLIEMESHALTDTSVELGGVMLGGQLNDEEGEPYVLVKDSVRAQHYEATKGSFKFTHDTWGQITKDRDEFPSDWDMVGWYHTHPDWGVFLSGMDMFICDNFFNKPLDVALVIDPCRQDRAFFQWTGDPRERKRRVGGFYVIASRHRQAEIEQFVAELEGGITMRTDPNIRAGYNVSSGGGAPTIVNISEQRPGWMGQAIVGMLFVQLVMLLMFGYVAFGNRGDDAPAASSDKQALLAAKERDLKLKRDVLDDVVESMSGQEDVVKELEEKQLKAAELEHRLIVAEAGSEQLLQERDKYKKDAEDFELDAKKYKDDLEALEAKYKKLGADHDLLLASVKEGGDASAWKAKYLTWPWITLGVVVLAFVGAAGYFAFQGMSGQDEYPEDFAENRPPEGNFSGTGEPDQEVDFEDESPREPPPDAAG